MNRVLLIATATLIAGCTLRGIDFLQACDCGPGACIDGICQPYALSNEAASWLVVDDTHAYYYAPSAQQIKVVQLVNPSSPVPWAVKPLPTLHDFDMVGGDVYYTDDTGLTKGSKGTGLLGSALIAQGITARGLRVSAKNASQVYWTTGDKIYSLGQYRLSAKVLDVVADDASGSLFFVETKHTDPSFPPTPCTTGSSDKVQILVDDRGEDRMNDLSCPMCLATNGRYVAVSDTGNGRVVLRDVKALTNQTAIRPILGSLPLGVALDATHLYWVDYNGGELVSYEIATGKLTVRAAGLRNPLIVVSQGDTLYWTSSDGVFGLRK
jgi:hypothetical protein